MICVEFDSHRHVDGAIDYDHGIFAGAPQVGTFIDPEIAIGGTFYVKLAMKGNPALEADRSVYEETRTPISLS